MCGPSLSSLLACVVATLAPILLPRCVLLHSSCVVLALSLCCPCTCRWLSCVLVHAALVSFALVIAVALFVVLSFLVRSEACCVLRSFSLSPAGFGTCTPSFRRRRRRAPRWGLDWLRSFSVPSVSGCIWFPFPFAHAVLCTRTSPPSPHPPWGVGLVAHFSIVVAWASCFLFCLILVAFSIGFLVRGWVLLCRSLALFALLLFPLVSVGLWLCACFPVLILLHYRSYPVVLLFLRFLFVWCGGVRVRRLLLLLHRRLVPL